MMDNLLTTVLRNAELRRIQENPVNIEVPLRDMKTDSYGKQIPDLSKPSVICTIGPVRIASMNNPVIQSTGGEPDRAVLNDYMIVAPWNATFLKNNMVFMANGVTYRIYKASPVLYRGIVISNIAYAKREEAIDEAYEVLDPDAEGTSEFVISLVEYRVLGITQGRVLGVS